MEEQMRATKSTSKWSFTHLKKSAPKVKVLLKWWRHQKQVHHNHIIRSKITRSWSSSEDERLKTFKVVSMDLITHSIAEDQKTKSTAKSNGFQGIGCLFFEERWQSTIVRSVQPLPPLLRVCLCNTPFSQHKNFFKKIVMYQSKHINRASHS